MELIDTSAASMARAVDALRRGEVIAYPTETVYGLGVDPFNVDALHRLFAVKGRDHDQAVLLLVDGPKQLEKVSSHISERAQAYMDAFWPGPLSLLLPKHPALPEAVAPGRERICVRCPGAAWARALCTAFGGPITSTSANASGEPPVEDLHDLQLPGISLGIDAGRLPPSPPSTIVDVESGVLLREGAIRQSDLDRVLNWKSGQESDG